jgi:hypothetical protein
MLLFVKFNLYKILTKYCAGKRETKFPEDKLKFVLPGRKIKTGRDCR